MPAITRLAIVTIPLLALAAAASGADLEVVSVEPLGNSLGAHVGSPIRVHFDRAVDPATVTPQSFWAFGRWSGTVSGTYAFSGGGATVTLAPDHPFSAGETVMVILSHDIEAADGMPLRASGYSWQFWTRAGAADMAFEEIDVMTTRTVQNQPSRAYGGIGSDLDGDRFLDITTVNEITADLRVFMNHGDGSGLYAPFIQPTFPVMPQASPSEPGDFDRDGRVDICVANSVSNSVSVLLGNGDGTFAPHQLIPVGSNARGIAVLDVDGDGDMDIVNTNSSSNNLSVLLNGGNGVFGSPAFFEGGGSGEWALAAADMNEDGLLDLVVGAKDNQRVIVQKSDGDGTFTIGGNVAAGGAVWMIACGDVNGDGHADVTAANSGTNNGAVILGDGAGGLGAAQTHPTDSFPLATDLGDLDGDGDLDWVTSSFNGDWRLFSNDGAGGFTFDQEIPAPDAASCALPMDLDNDGDLDLALVDELDDLVILMRNVGSPCFEDLDGTGSVGFADLSILLAAWGPCPPGCPEDLDGSGSVGFADLSILLAAWGPC